jgi:hypothetical protein
MVLHSSDLAWCESVDAKVSAVVHKVVPQVHEFVPWAAVRKFPPGDSAVIEVCSLPLGCCKYNHRNTTAATLHHQQRGKELRHSFMGGLVQQQQQQQRQFSKSALQAW